MPNSIFFPAITCFPYSQTSKRSLHLIRSSLPSNAVETVFIRSNYQTLSLMLPQRELLIISSLKVSSPFTCRPLSRSYAISLLLPSLLPWLLFLWQLPACFFFSRSWHSSHCMPSSGYPIHSEDLTTSGHWLLNLYIQSKLLSRSADVSFICHWMSYNHCKFNMLLILLPPPSCFPSLI